MEVNNLLQIGRVAEGEENWGGGDDRVDEDMVVCLSRDMLWLCECLYKFIVKDWNCLNW